MHFLLKKNILSNKKTRKREVDFYSIAISARLVSKAKPAKKPTFAAAMEKSNFIDYIRIFCRSGHGGPGSRHFMRTKYNAMAGPDGGDGGRGAHIILRGSTQLWTLLHLRYYKNVLAEDGESGSKNNSTGKFGKDINYI